MWSSCASRRAALRRRSCRATWRRLPGSRTSLVWSCIRTRCAPKTSNIPTSCASISTRCRESRGSRSRKSQPYHALCFMTSTSSDGRRRPVRAACTSASVSNLVGTSTKCVAPRWHSRVKSRDVHRSSRPASGGRRSATVCSSITTRTPRTAPLPPRTPYGQRPTHAFRRRLRGTRSTSATRRISRSLPCPRASRSLATCTRKSMSTPARSKDCSSSSSARAWVTHRGRRTTGDRRRSLLAFNPPSANHRSQRSPLIEIGRARRKEDALAGLERWKARHPQAAAHLQPADVLVDSMRGRSSTWTRIRVNLQHVPEELRPAQEPLDPDEKIFSSS